jgi:type I site-specific restriction endonuclease
MNPERQTRQGKIDLQLFRAGWAVGSRRLVEEFLVNKASLISFPKTSYPSNTEFADYALF